MDGEYICVDEEYYDPYFILGVTRDDSDSHIAKAYKTRAKKYHPDKAPVDKIKKYEKRFAIVLESYEFIKKRRRAIGVKRELKNESQSVDDFNKEFEKITSPYDFGYGTQSRIQDADEYKSFETNIVNQFRGKKFSKEAFNKLFTYNKKIQTREDDHTSKALVHKTSDGFYGFNTADLANCALVSSFNGLLITGDNFGENGVGYYSNEYSDYKHSYNSAKNPENILELNKIENEDENDDEEEDVNGLYKKYKSVYKTPVNVKGGSYSQQQEQLMKNVMNDLIEKEEHDKEMIMRYNKIYKKELLKQALEGRLDTSPNFIRALKYHYNAKQIL